MSRVVRLAIGISRFRGLGMRVEGTGKRGSGLRAWGMRSGRHLHTTPKPLAIFGLFRPECLPMGRAPK